MRSDEDKVKDINNTLKVLQEIRRPFEGMIDDILTYIYHGRRKVKDGTQAKGQKTGTQVYDGTALGAANLLTDGFTGYTISKSFRWFAYTLPQRMVFPRYSGMRQWSGKRVDSIPEIKAWLEDAEEAMYSALMASNLYDIAPEIVRDAVTVGTVTVNIEEDIKNSRVIFRVPHFRECYVAENYFGEVDTHYRDYKLTLKQLKEKFGFETMKEADTNFKDKYDKNMHQEMEVVHACYPREDYDVQKLNKKNKPYASIWVLKPGNKLLLESGFDDSAFLTWRWRKNNDEWYGRSPAWDAFIDVMTANQAGRTNLIAGHKMVEPPMVGTSDLRGQVNIGPKGWTWVKTMDRAPKPLVTGIQLPYGIEMQDRYRDAIKDHFHVDFFLMLSQAVAQKVELTATQVIEMGGEKAAILGLRIGKFETEFLNPAHDKVFHIEYRAKRIPRPPDILLDLAGGDIETEYLGPLAQAQKKLFKSQGITQGLDAIGGISEIFPEILDLINPDEAGKELLISRGFPQKAMNSPNKIKKIRQLRQQKQELMEEIAIAEKAARSAPAAGKEVSPDSPLGEMMGYKEE